MGRFSSGGWYGPRTAKSNPKTAISVLFAPEMRMLLFDFVVPALPGTDKGYGGTPSYAMSGTALLSA